MQGVETLCKCWTFLFAPHFFACPSMSWDHADFLRGVCDSSCTFLQEELVIWVRLHTSQFWSFLEMRDHILLP